ncbi:uncharacterized protein LOC143211913 [Lasioglossum baleicum]|uniref:uncharacterized protein LOC143211913 n=1 Tax=Lasioglossum baleicum TaxID=434251 RepID=UPI003FCD24C5
MATKVVELYKDSRWSTKDKLDQYRGILKLYGREKKLRQQDAVKLKRRVSWQLNTFREDVKKYRQLVKDTKTQAYRVLRGHRDLQLKCLDRGAEHTYSTIYEDNCLRRRRLDILRYEKKKKMKFCFELQLEHAEYSERYAEEQQMIRTAAEGLQQQLIARYQLAIAKQNAAKAIHITYSCMLEILKQDSVRHDALLDILKQDRRSQCKVILKATIMGQLAVEETDDIEQKCKLLTRKVWNNMKERERTLALVRSQVEDLWSYAQSLIRTESETILTMQVRDASMAANESLERQVKSLEKVLQKVQESLLVRSYRELLSRLEEQMKQRTRLLEQFNRNVRERDSLLSRKNEALTSLSEIEHAVVANVEAYNADRNALLAQITMQQQRRIEHRKVRKVRGELLMDIRAALQNMVAMLFCVRRGVVRAQKKKTSKEGKDDTEEEALPSMEKVETEGLALLSTVSRKVGALFGMSNFEFDQDRDERAKDLYQTYVSNYNSKLKFRDEEADATGFIVEHEAIDSTVLTRADIKLRSKQAVEAFTRLQ